MGPSCRSGHIDSHTNRFGLCLGLPVAIVTTVIDYCCLSWSYSGEESCCDSLKKHLIKKTKRNWSLCHCYKDQAQCYQSKVSQSGWSQDTRPLWKYTEDADVYSALPFHWCVSAGMSTRDGTDVDAANVENTFSKLGYKVKVHHNQTAAQMKKLMLDGKKSFGSFMFTCVWRTILPVPLCWSQFVSWYCLQLDHVCDSV